MLKHMLTTKCNRKCSYCITRNVSAKQELDINKVETLYLNMYAAGHKDIMLTGGEPTLAEKFFALSLLAMDVFDNVHITTQNEKIFVFDGLGGLHSTIAFFDSVVVSLHDKPLYESVMSAIHPHRDYTNDIPKFYAAMLDEQYYSYPEIVTHLIENGWDGLTINEEQREGEKWSDCEWMALLPPDFSFRVNRRGHCMDETIILPNLEVITDFRPYL